MRAAVFDQTGHRLAIAYRPIESRMGEGRVEQDPEDWWRAALETLDEVLADRALAGRVSPDDGDHVGRLPRRHGPRTASRSAPAIMISDVRPASRPRGSRRDPAFAALGSPAAG